VIGADRHRRHRMPLGGALIVATFGVPADCAIRPPIVRSSDLPDPDRPSRPTISPDLIIRSTSTSSPLPLGKGRQTPWISEEINFAGLVEHRGSS
jgi:hypothetical protein